MDYISLIHSICDALVEQPEALLIKELPTENKKEVLILVAAKNSDTARLIGKKGCVANAIRDIVSIAGKLENKRVNIKFDSLEAKGE